MFKYFSSTLLLVVLCGGSLIQVPEHAEVLTLDYEPLSEFWTEWGPGLMEFMELIDLEQLMGVFVGYLNDPEVLNFMGFILSPQFKEIVWELESLAEFEQAFVLLKSKGYDVETILNSINAALELPPYEQSTLFNKVSSDKGEGISGLFEDIIKTLPIEDIKKLFEAKLETNQRFEEIFETINSEEFMRIMRSMSQNPKFIKMKETFKSYGFDFKYVCDLAEQIFGNYYQGIFCE